MMNILLIVLIIILSISTILEVIKLFLDYKIKQLAIQRKKYIKFKQKRKKPHDRNG